MKLAVHAPEEAKEADSITGSADASARSLQQQHALPSAEQQEHAQISGPVLLSTGRDLLIADCGPLSYFRHSSGSIAYILCTLTKMKISAGNQTSWYAVVGILGQYLANRAAAQTGIGRHRLPDSFSNECERHCK